MSALLSDDGSTVRIFGMADWLMWAIVAFPYVLDYIIYPAVIIGIGVWIIRSWRKMNREGKAEQQRMADRIAKLDADNERMITLLTEIRDRLPPQPPPGVRLVA